jgi:uncharacterized membrane protein
MLRTPSAVRAPNPVALPTDATVEVGLGPSWPQRAWWTLAGCALINWSVQVLGAVTTFSWLTIPLVVAGGWGLATVIVSWLPLGESASTRRWGEVLSWATALLLVGTFAAWAYTQVRNSPGYGTDELAFDQYAAALTRHGANPYVHSMAPSFSLFQVSPDGYTYTLTGAPVTQLSYPALAFLIYVPLLALGWATQLAVALNVGAWSLAILLMFLLLPRSMRGAALVLGSISVYISYAVGGVTDALYVPLLVLAAYRWDRFGESRRSYAGPLMLGLAMAIKQTPWLVLVFVVAGIVCDANARGGPRPALRRGLAYLATALGAFLAPNIPFIAMAPSAWWHGVITPIASHLVPAGQGAVALSLFLRIGGGSLTAFTAATALFGLLLLLTYVGTYPMLRTATFALPALVLFFASRSYGSYLVSLIPAALVAAVTARRPLSRAARRAVVGRRGPPRPTRWGLAIGGAAAAFVAALVFALTSQSPLNVRILGVRTTGQLATIEQLSLRVTNTSDKPVTPAFSLDEGGSVTTFWHVARGPATLAPGGTAAYRIISPNFPAQPTIGGGFSVLAFASSPASVSASGPYVPTRFHVGLVPDAINKAVPFNRPVTIRAELLDHFDRPVSKSGIPIYLGQVIYEQTGLELSEAVVNAHAPGQTPVAAHTNSKGVATFTIVGTQAGANPVYFEANLVSAKDFYPYGYSAILPIRFSKP